MAESCRVLVLYDQGDLLEILAQEVAAGIGAVPGTEDDDYRAHSADAGQPTTPS